MSKILVMPPDFDDIDSLIKLGVDGFILGIKDFSLFGNLQMTIEELREVIPKIRESNKEIFISLNKIIYNKDIPKLKEYLLILDRLDINGILYDDIAIVKLKSDLKLKVDLVWNQMHIPTNYYTCNYWYHKHHIKYGFLSSEITLDEIIEIKNNTEMRLLVNVFGYLPMFESSRSLLTNYFSYINQAKKKDSYKINEPIRNSSYPIYEDVNGTYILSSHILNALIELPTLIKNKIDYLVLNSLCIDKKLFMTTCHAYVEVNKNPDDNKLIEDLAKDIDSKSTDKGFFYKETIYRVKSND